MAVALSTLVLFALFACWALLRARRVTYPSGPLNRRGTSLGNEVVVIDAPGNEAKRMMLVEACATVTVAAFTAWRDWRPNDVPAQGIYPIITVHFVDDRTMDEVQRAVFSDVGPIDAYLSDASSAVQHVPLIVVRKSCARQVITTGQPVIQEVVRVLINCYGPDEVFNPITGTHEAWENVERAACAKYTELYSPEAQLQKR